MSVPERYKVMPVDKRETKEWFKKKHYAGRPPSCSFAYGLYDTTDSLYKLVGIISFGTPANYKLNDLVPGYTIMELNRLIINDGMQKNVLSYFLSQSLMQLPKPMVVISYADSGQGHHGYIYQATNWFYAGQTKEEAVYVKAGNKMHGKSFSDKYGTRTKAKADELGYTIENQPPKHRYFYFLGTKKEIKDMHSKLPYEQLPYPKGDNIRYDASYSPPTQLVFNPYDL